MLPHVRVIPGAGQQLYNHWFFWGQDITGMFCQKHSAGPEWHYRTSMHEIEHFQSIGELRPEMKMLCRQTGIIPPPTTRRASIKWIQALAVCAPLSLVCMHLSACLFLCKGWGKYQLQRSLQGCNFSLIEDNVFLYILFVVFLICRSNVNVNIHCSTEVK